MHGFEFIFAFLAVYVFQLAKYLNFARNSGTLLRFLSKTS